MSEQFSERPENKNESKDTFAESKSLTAQEEAEMTQQRETESRMRRLDEVRHQIEQQQAQLIEGMQSLLADVETVEEEFMGESYGAKRLVKETHTQLESNGKTYVVDLASEGSSRSASRIYRLRLQNTESDNDTLSLNLEYDKETGQFGSIRINDTYIQEGFTAEREERLQDAPREAELNELSSDLTAFQDILIQLQTSEL